MENSWTSAASCRRLQGLHAEHGVRWRGLSCSFIGGPTMIGCSTIKGRSCTSTPCLPFQLYLVPVLRQLYANRSATRLKIEERAALLDQLKIGRCSTHLVFLNGDELVNLSDSRLQDDRAVMSSKTVSGRGRGEKWREKSERAWAQDRWRAQNGDARKQAERIDEEGRGFVEEGDEGAVEGSAGGLEWVTRRTVSIGGVKKEKKREGRGKRREGGKKLKPPLKSNPFLGQGCREWKSKSASALRS